MTAKVLMDLLIKKIRFKIWDKNRILVATMIMKIIVAIKCEEVPNFAP